MTDHFVEAPKKVLSPAARKVRDAVRKICPAPADEIAAAAICALADQVWLAMPLGNTDADAGVFAAHRAICTNMLTIAIELKSQ